jgi:5-methylcytosine-specific restriction endonuclease McrA
MEDLKCQHCGSVNLDLDHIFPSCLECYHFLPNITRKAAINAILADFMPKLRPKLCGNSCKVR